MIQHLPLKFQKYAKFYTGVITAIATALLLMLAGKLGIDVSQEIVDLGPESQEITWRQAINGLAPLLAVLLVPNHADVTIEDDPNPTDDDGDTTLGGDASEYVIDGDK